jgi:hypothetical protein
MLAWLNSKLDLLLAPGGFVQSNPEGRDNFNRLVALQVSRERRFGPLLDELRSPQNAKIVPPLVIEFLEHYIRVENRPLAVGPGRPARPKIERREAINPLVWMAAQDVPRIRQLWWDHYRAKKRSVSSTAAEDFAAMRWWEKEPEFPDWQTLAEAVRRLMRRSKEKRLDQD